MKFKRSLLFFAACFPLLLSGITLQGAIESAIENNHALQQEEIEIEVYDQKYYAARGMLLPQLKIQGEYKLQWLKLPDSSVFGMSTVSSLLSDQPNEMSSADGAIWENQQVIAGYLDGIVSQLTPLAEQHEGSFAGGLQLDQIVFSGGKLLSGINIADRVRNMQKDRYRLSKQELVYETIKKYYQVKLAEEVVNIQRSALELTAAHLQDVNKMFDEGLVSEYSKLRAELEYRRLEPELMQAEHNYILAKENFCDHLGCEELDELQTEFSIPEYDDYQLETAINLGMDSRIEVQLSELNVRIQEVLVKMEQADYYPQIGFSASYNFYTTADDYAIERADFGRMASIGLGFQLPIFTGLTRISEIREAKAKVIQAEEADAELREMIKLDIQNAWQKLEYSKSNLDVQKDNISLAERGYKIAQSRYSNGLGTELEITDAQLLLKQSKISYSKAMYDLILAESYYRKAIGRELYQ